MYKPKKVNQKTKTNKKKDPSKFHLGRNLGTYLLIFGTVVLVVLIYTILWCTVIGKNSYTKVYKANDVDPYNDGDSSGYTYSDAIRMEGKDFKEMDFKFKCTSFDQEAGTAKFGLTLVKNENTKNLQPMDSSLAVKSSSSYNVYAYVCLAADWVGYEKYSSIKGFTKTNVEKTLSEATEQTVSVTLDSEKTFPMKTETWPVKVKVATPDAYVFLCFFYNENGKDVAQQYVLHYSYDEYVTNETSPVIPRK